MVAIVPVPLAGLVGTDPRTIEAVPAELSKVGRLNTTGNKLLAGDMF
jgi:hypothetical protein